MEYIKKYGKPCTGRPCDTIGLSKTGHAHIPYETETDTSTLSISEDAVTLAERIIASPDGRISDSDEQVMSVSCSEQDFFVPLRT